MSIPSVITTAAAQHEHLPVHPYVIGAVTFAILVVMLVALLAFGKGRDHS